MNRWTITLGSLIVAALAAAGIILTKDKPDTPAPKYPATLASLSWESPSSWYIRWSGDQSVFPTRKGNLSGMIIAIEPNGHEVAVEYIRPGYTRQHMKNGAGSDEHALKNTKPGDTIQIYLCALTANGRPDKSIRTNTQPLKWRTP